MIITIVIFTVLYLVLIGSFIYGFDKILEFKLEDIPAETRFSVIIPFRNEAENLPVLLKSIKELDYPKHLFEILFVNDDSSDTSVELIRDSITLDFISIQILDSNRLTNSPKKDAIQTAINQAKNLWILTTDADCKLPKYWLSSFDCFIQKNASDVVVGPVKYDGISSFLDRFQTLDFLSLMGVTIGSFGIKKPFLANGANLAYKKSTFHKLSGFDDNAAIASGDDVFLLQKAVKENQETVHYLKSKQAIVITKPQPNVSALISQRLRWAAKTSSYQSLFGKLAGLLVFIMNALIIIMLLLTVSSVLKPSFLLYIFIIKIAIDFLLIFKASRFFNHEDILASFLFASLLYPFFSTYIVCLSVFKGYKWKDRSFNK